MWVSWSFRYFERYIFRSLWTRGAPCHIILGVIIGGAPAAGQDAHSSALLTNLPLLSSHSSSTHPTLGRDVGAALEVGLHSGHLSASQYLGIWVTRGIFWRKEGEEQMAPNFKRNKAPIVLSCIYFHWKTAVFLHSPFTFRNLQKWYLIFWSMKYMVMDDHEYVICWAKQFPWLSKPCTGLIQHSQPACT